MIKQNQMTQGILKKHTHTHKLDPLLISLAVMWKWKKSSNWKLKWVWNFSVPPKGHSKEDVLCNSQHPSLASPNSASQALICSMVVSEPLCLQTPHFQLYPTSPTCRTWESVSLSSAWASGNHHPPHPASPWVLPVFIALISQPFFHMALTQPVQQNRPWEALAGHSHSILIPRKTA